MNIAIRASEAGSIQIIILANACPRRLKRAFIEFYSFVFPCCNLSRVDRKRLQ